MPEIIKRVEINTSPETAWRVIADFGAVATWARSVREAHCTSESVSGPGCVRLLTSSTGHVIEEIITRWDEGRSLTFHVPGGLAVVVAFLQETWSVEAAPNGSRVVVIMKYRSRFGFLGAAVTRLIVRPVLTRMLIENLAGLKYHLETGVSVTQGTALPVLAVVGQMPGSEK